MKTDDLYSKAALAGYIDEDTGTVTADMLSYYLDDRKWAFVEYMESNHDFRPTADEALNALKDNNDDFDLAAEWVLESLDDIDYAAEVRWTYYFMAMKS